MPYTKKENKKTIKELDKIAKEENLKVAYVNLNKKKDD